MALYIAAVSEQADAEWLTALRAHYQLARYAWEEGLEERLAADGPALVICDLSLSPMDRELAFRRVRILLEVPILVLGPVADEAFAVRMLKHGADGYLGAPFSASELLARVEAHLRRYWEWQGQLGAFSDSGMLIDRAACSVTLENRVVKLTPTECRLLSRLADHEGAVVPREELGQALWGVDETQDPSALVSLYVHYLRQKLEKDPRFPRYIRTKRGGGYYLTVGGT